MKSSAYSFHKQVENYSTGEKLTKNNPVYEWANYIESMKIIEKINDLNYEFFVDENIYNYKNNKIPSPFYLTCLIQRMIFFSLIESGIDSYDNLIEFFEEENVDSYNVVGEINKIKNEFVNIKNLLTNKKFTSGDENYNGLVYLIQNYPSSCLLTYNKTSFEDNMENKFLNNLKENQNDFFLYFKFFIQKSLDYFFGFHIIHFDMNINDFLTKFRDDVKFFVYFLTLGEFIYADFTINNKLDIKKRKYFNSSLNIEDSLRMLELSIKNLSKIFSKKRNVDDHFENIYYLETLLYSFEKKRDFFFNGPAYKVDHFYSEFYDIPFESYSKMNKSNLDEYKKYFEYMDEIEKKLFENNQNNGNLTSLYDDIRKYVIIIIKYLNLDYFYNASENKKEILEIFFTKLIKFINDVEKISQELASLVNTFKNDFILLIKDKLKIDKYKIDIDNNYKVILTHSIFDKNDFYEEDSNKKINKLEINDEDYTIDAKEFYEYYFYTYEFHIGLKNKEDFLNFIVSTNNCDILTKDILLKIIYVSSNSKYTIIDKKSYNDFLDPNSSDIFPDYRNFSSINHNFNEKVVLHNILEKYLHYTNNFTTDYKNKKVVSPICVKNNGQFFYQIFYNRLYGYDLNIDYRLIDYYFEKDKEKYLEYFHSDVLKNLYNNIVKIYNYSTQKFVDIWNLIKSSGFITLSVFSCSLLTSYLLLNLNQSSLNFNDFSNYIQYLISDYHLLDIKNLSNDSEIQKALINCEKFNFIPERVFSNPIQNGIKYSTAYLFNRVSTLIDLFNVNKIDNNEDFILLSGIKPPLIEYNQLEPYIDEYSNKHDTNVLIKDLILLEKKIEIKDIIPFLISYYRGNVELNEKEKISVINIFDVLYLIENHVLYFLYIILGKEMIKCEMITN